MATDNFLLNNRSPDVKVQITPTQPKKLTHLPQRPKVDLAFSNLTYTVRQGKKDKVILKNVSGRLRSGELCAIMGPSGAGKSSLLNILTGYKTEGTTGQILINNNERDLSQFMKLSAYIMQDNQLHANLTVDEAMAVAAKLKIGGKKLHEREDIITEILDTLGLLDHRKTMTSGLSGGQKKRLSIALELVSNPPIMFFDEPTSGLDSSSCFQCISLLKTLAKGGRTIICTIHQPSARLFEMFDQLYTLADGQCVYQGSTNQLVPFLGTLGLQCPSYHNPASYIIEVACGEYGDHTRKLVCAIDNGKNDIRDGKPFPELKFDDGINNSELYAKENTNTLLANRLAKESATNYEKNINVAGEQTIHNQNTKLSNKDMEKRNIKTTLLKDILSTDPIKDNSANGSGSNETNTLLANKLAKESATNYEKNTTKNVAGEQTIHNQSTKLSNMDMKKQNMNTTLPKDILSTEPVEDKCANGSGSNERIGTVGIEHSAIDVEKPDATSTLLENTLAVKQPRYGNSELQQFFIILRRALLFSRRDWTLMYLRLFAHILVGCLIGALYFKIGNDGSKVLSNLGFLFFNMLFLMYTSMTITILSFPLELPVLLKEHFNRWYSLRSYYLAITISDMPFQTVFCILYVTIVYFMTSQPPEIDRYGMFLLACLLVSFVAQSVGLVVGAAMNVQNGVFLAPVMSVPFLLFSGFFVSFDAIPIYLRWITYLSYIRYGFEGTALATYGFNRPKLECFTSYCHFKSPEITLGELDMDKSSYSIDIIALVVIFFVLRISAFLFLKWKLKSNR